MTNVPAIEPGDRFDVLHTPERVSGDVMEEIRVAWFMLTGRKCVVLGGVSYGGTLTAPSPTLALDEDPRFIPSPPPGGASDSR